MKKITLFLLALLLFCPSVAIAGSRYGASLWLFELLPTLLPFFIAVRLFQYCLPRAADKRASCADIPSEPLLYPRNMKETFCRRKPPISTSGL